MVALNDEGQMSLDLGDRLLYLKAYAEKLHKEYGCYSDTTIVILSSQKPDTYWLGTRTFVYDTDYERFVKINGDEARYLVENCKVSSFLSHDKLYPRKPCKCEECQCGKEA